MKHKLQNCNNLFDVKVRAPPLPPLERSYLKLRNYILTFVVLHSCRVLIRVHFRLLPQLLAPSKLVYSSQLQVQNFTLHQTSR